MVKSHVGRSPRGATLPSTISRRHYNYSRSLFSPGSQHYKKPSSAVSTAPSDRSMLCASWGAGTGLCLLLCLQYCTGMIRLPWQDLLKWAPNFAKMSYATSCSSIKSQWGDGKKPIFICLPQPLGGAQLELEGSTGFRNPDRDPFLCFSQ